MKRKAYTKMSAAELAVATREFDQPRREPAFLSPSPTEKRTHDGAVRAIKRRRGRPRVGAGAMRVQITMERSLLDKADRFARSQGLSRSELITRCLTPVLAKKSA